MKTSALLLGSTTTATTTQTLAWPAGLFPVNQYEQMDVIVNVSALSGSVPTVAFSIRELFSDVGYVETCASGNISTIGTFFLSHDYAVVGTPSYIKGQSPVLGKGGQKQCVITQGGTVSTISCSVYLIPDGGVE